MSLLLWNLLASAALAAVAATNTTLQTTFPTASSTTNLLAARTILAGETFDGGIQEWDRSPSTCKQQEETGEQDAVFILEHNATLSNAIIGPNNGEGVHCRGTCTLNNMHVSPLLRLLLPSLFHPSFSSLASSCANSLCHSWWTSVCEDAATFRQPLANDTSYVSGGGARNAADKVFQHNGAGTVIVENFVASNIGKLYRSCGNCNTQYARHSEFRNVRVEKAKVVAGVNGNFGDTTVVRDSCVLKGGVCWRYEGNAEGKEPMKVGSGEDGVVCVVEGVKTSGC
jgi:hypothetical protein